MEPEANAVQRQVAAEVVLANEPEVVVRFAEFIVPGTFVAASGGGDAVGVGVGVGEEVVAEVGMAWSAEREAWSVVGGIGFRISDFGFQISARIWKITELHKLRDIIGAAGFHARPERGFAKATEGLAQDHGASGDAIDVEIAGVEVAFPVVPFALVEALEAAGQAVTGLVGQRDCLAQFLEAHDCEDRSEQLGQMRETAGPNAIFDAGGPKVRIALERLEIGRAN